MQSRCRERRSRRAASSARRRLGFSCALGQRQDLQGQVRVPEAGTAEGREEDHSWHPYSPNLVHPKHLFITWKRLLSGTYLIRISEWCGSRFFFFNFPGDSKAKFRLIDFRLFGTSKIGRAAPQSPSQVVPQTQISPISLLT